MPNKANKFSKRAKSPTANAEVNPLPKEPHSALAVVIQALAVPPRKVVPIRVVVTANITSLAIRAVLRKRVRAKMTAQQLTGLKST